jgi:N-acetylglutamate synthase-like GNAT family acetyltransferase
MNNNYFLESDMDSHQVIQLLEDKIYEYNSAKINKDDGSLFSRIVKDENSEIIAGIAGWTWAGICEITQLWVNDKVRKNGIGKMLLEEAEAEAKSKECRTILIKSYSFQAPCFYEKFGYKSEHILNDYPEGYNYYTLTKRIG